MDIFSPAVDLDAQPQQASSPEVELVQLRAQVAWLEEERAALWWAVGHDELTGLANRRLFHALAPPLLRERGSRAVVIVLDLNGFKPINDRFGHDAGDHVLRIVAGRLASCATDSLAARFGGDEFAAVLASPHPPSCPYWWQRVVASLSATIAEPIPIAGKFLRVTASIGVAPAHGDAPIGELLRRADLAMYQAKLSGRSDVAWDADAVNDAVRACGEPRCVGHRQRYEAIVGDPTAVPPETVRQGRCPSERPYVLELAIYPSTGPAERRVSAPNCGFVQHDAPACRPVVGTAVIPSGSTDMGPGGPA